MVKRSNDNSQLSKEELEALESQDEETPTGSFERASNDVMKRRKLLSVSAEKKASSSAAAASSSLSTSKMNPFAKVSFAPTTTPPPIMSPDKKPIFKTPAPPSFVTHSSSSNNNGALSELATAFRRHVSSLPIQGGEWTVCMMQYKTFREGLSVSNTNTTAASTIAAAPTTWTVPSAFSNNTTNSSHAVTPALLTATPIPAATATPPTAATTTTTMKPPAASPFLPSGATTLTTNTTDSDKSFEQSDKFYKVRARYYKFADGSFVVHKAGVLSLEHDHHGKRIVIRMDGSGTIQFCCALPKDIAIDSQKTVKGEMKRFIRFVTKLEGEEHPVPIRLETKAIETDILYEKIRELGEKVSMDNEE